MVPQAGSRKVISLTLRTVGGGRWAAGSGTKIIQRRCQLGIGVQFKPETAEGIFDQKADDPPGCEELGNSRNIP